MSPVLKRVPPLPQTHRYFKGNACLLVLPGNSCKQFFIALPSISNELESRFKGSYLPTAPAGKLATSRWNGTGLKMRAFSSAETVLHSYVNWTARARDSNSPGVSLTASCELYVQPVSGSL